MVQNSLLIEQYPKLDGRTDMYSSVSLNGAPSKLNELPGAASKTTYVRPMRTTYNNSSVTKSKHESKVNMKHVADGINHDISIVPVKISVSTRFIHVRHVLHTCL
jgi:hypothetical protein